MARLAGSRTRAGLAAVGFALFAVVVVPLAYLSTQELLPYYETRMGGGPGMAITMFPGVLLIASFFILPTAAVLVLVMGRLMERCAWANGYVAWAVGGMVVGLPAAVFLSLLYSSGRSRGFGEAMAVLAALGILSGLAGRMAYPDRNRVPDIKP